MTKWFKHEEDLAEGESPAEPILGPRYSPFWFFGMGFLAASVLMGGYLALKFILSAAHAAH